MAYQLLAPGLALAVSGLLSVSGACALLETGANLSDDKRSTGGSVFGTRSSGGQTGNGDAGSGSAPGVSGSSGSGAGAGDASARVAPHGARVSNWTDYVPREPMWFVNAGSGTRRSSHHPEDNARGLNLWWRGPNAVPNLVGKIAEGYQVGARWFFINRPMGTDGGSHVPAASWLTIDADKRERITDELNDMLLDRFEEPVHIVWFIGSDMSDPRSIRGWTASRDDENFQIGQTENWKQLTASRATLGGWLSTGASGIAFDHSAPSAEREHFIDLFHQLIRPPFGLMVMGEAFPVEPRPRGGPMRHADGTRVLAMGAMESMPFLAEERILMEYWPTTFAPGERSLDPDTTRAYVWMSWATIKYGSPEQRRQRIRGWLERGLIPITMDPVMFREAQDYLRQN
ncbi:MAG: hypothetical protein AAGA55_02285 [Planctomycetota bacterium]